MCARLTWHVDVESYASMYVVCRKKILVGDKLNVRGRHRNAFQVPDLLTVCQGSLSENNSDDVAQHFLDRLQVYVGPGCVWL
jgi:hypothetical protein